MVCQDCCLHCDLTDIGDGYMVCGKCGMKIKEVSE
jgi:hypothetical protein